MLHKAACTAPSLPSSPSLPKMPSFWLYGAGQYCGSLWRPSLPTMPSLRLYDGPELSLSSSRRCMATDHVRNETACTCLGDVCRSGQMQQAGMRCGPGSCNSSVYAATYHTGCTNGHGLSLGSKRVSKKRTAACASAARAAEPVPEAMPASRAANCRSLAATRLLKLCTAASPKQSLCMKLVAPRMGRWPCPMCVQPAHLSLRQEVRCKLPASVRTRPLR